MNSDLALTKIIEEYVSREIENIKIVDENTTKMYDIDFNPEEFAQVSFPEDKKEYFSSKEFENISLPEEKKQSIIKKAIEWIKERTINHKGQDKKTKQKTIKREIDIER